MIAGSTGTAGIRWHKTFQTIDNYHHLSKRRHPVLMMLRAYVASLHCTSRRVHTKVGHREWILLTNEEMMMMMMMIIIIIITLIIIVIIFLVCSRGLTFTWWGCCCLFLTQTNRACPLLFILFLCLFLSLWPFQLYYISKIFPTTFRFLTLFFWSYFSLVGHLESLSLSL